METILKTVGDRLRIERESKRKNQTDFAALAGVSKATQIRYEAGTGTPTASYLASLVAIGVDIGFVLTGVRSVIRPGMSAADLEQFNQLVDDFWSLSDDDRAHALRYLSAMAQAAGDKDGGSRGIRKPPVRKTTVR